MLDRPAYELFEPVDPVLCADGAVRSPVDLTLLPEHRRGRGAMHGGLNYGRIDTGPLRTMPAGVSLPRFDGGRLDETAHTARHHTNGVRQRRNRLGTRSEVSRNGTTPSGHPLPSA